MEEIQSIRCEVFQHCYFHEDNFLISLFLYDVKEKKKVIRNETILHWHVRNLQLSVCLCVNAYIMSIVCANHMQQLRVFSCVCVCVGGGLTGAGQEVPAAQQVLRRGS